MGKFVIVVLALFCSSQPSLGQVNTQVGDRVVDALLRGRQLRIEEENSEAQREVQRAQVELLNAQTKALQQQVGSYTEQEIQVGLLQLTQSHPDWKQYEQRMKAIVLLPAKGLSAYDYMLALYLLAKQKTIEEQSSQQGEARIRAMLLFAQFARQHADIELQANTMLKLFQTFPQKDGESEVEYLQRLYDLAKEESDSENPDQSSEERPILKRHNP